MIVPLLLLLASLISILVGLLIPEGDSVLLIGGSAAIASLFLVIRAWAFDGKRAARAQDWIVVDGSNVMYWKDNSPDIATLREVVEMLKSRGLTPGVIFDANAGHLLHGRYVHDHGFAARLGLPEKRVMVVDKGTPADPTILTAARDMGARVVSNDRFRDWQEQFPEVMQDGFLIAGGYRKGKLWLDLGDVSAAQGGHPATGKTRRA